jgi:hypothetical protein
VVIELTANITLHSRTPEMFWGLGMSDTGQFVPQQGHVSKRQYSSVDHSIDASSKRIRIENLVQDTETSNSEASISPQASSGSEIRHNSIADSSSSLSCPEDAIFV